MDDTEASSWKTTKGGSAVIKLAKESVVNTVQVSAYTNSRFEGLKSFTLQTSTDGVNWKTQNVGGTNAFGYQAPRPVVPDLHYKTFTLPTPTKAGFIRFWADEPQGNTKTNVQVGDIQVFSNTAIGYHPAAPAAARRAGDRDVHDRRGQPGQRGLPRSGGHRARERLHRPAGQPGQRRSRLGADG